MDSFERGSPPKQSKVTSFSRVPTALHPPLDIYLGDKWYRREAETGEEDATGGTTRRGRRSDQ